MKPTKRTKHLLSLNKTSTRMPKVRRKRSGLYRDTPAKLTPAQYSHVINYLYPV